MTRFRTGRNNPQLAQQTFSATAGLSLRTYWRMSMMEISRGFDFATLCILAVLSILCASQLQFLLCVWQTWSPPRHDATYIGAAAEGVVQSIAPRHILKLYPTDPHHCCHTNEQRAARTSLPPNPQPVPASPSHRAPLSSVKSLVVVVGGGGGAGGGAAALRPARVDAAAARMGHVGLPHPHSRPQGEPLRPPSASSEQLPS